MTRIKRIILPYGAISEIANAMGKSRDKVSTALSGLFDEFSKNYDEFMKIREYVTNKYKV